MITSPALPGTITVDGIPRNDWGMWTDLPAGTHAVCFGPVQGFNAPPCQHSAVLTAGNLTTVTGTYTSNPAAPGPTGVGSCGSPPRPPCRPRSWSTAHPVTRSG